MKHKMPGARAAAILSSATVAVASFAMIGGNAALAGQAPQGGAQPAGPPPTAQAGAAIDLTGNWVSIVNEDWRWRMVTPPKGDYASVPLTPAGRAEADKWTPAMDGQCQPYGVGAIMRMPTRVRISWQDSQTLKLEMDAGTQTRLIQFDPNAQPPSAPSLQGFTRGVWERPGGVARGAPPVGGSLKATTTLHTAGWLRKNGVPYTENAQIVEHFNIFDTPTGDQWFVVTTIITDPRVLNQPYVTSSHFRKEADGTKWAPSTCRPG